MPEVSDMELLRDYDRQGSEAAFAVLVQRHIHLVYSVAFRHVGIAAHAEEITQAVFIILARKAAGLRPDTILEGWLHETARLTALSFLRGERRRQFREQEAYMQSTLQESAEASAWNQLAPLLDEALSRLGKKDRDAVILRFFKDQSLHEVAAGLRVSEVAAQRRVLRALEKLHSYFSRRGISSTTAIIAGVMSAHSIQAAPVALAKSVTAVALAKGAAASASTLTLIKEALKLMAWAKVKSAAVAGAAVLLTAGMGVVVFEAVHSARVAAYPDLQGAWEGVAQLDNAGVASGETAKSHIVLKLTKSNGVYTATADWIEMARSNVPMGRVVYRYPSLRFERNPRDVWQLQVNAEATEMAWDHWIHFIQPDPVLLRRTRTPDPVPGRLAEGDFAPRAGSDLQGYWKGAIGTGPDSVPVNMKIAGLADGSFRAEGDNPMQGANGQPLTVSYDPPAVKLVLASGGGMFQGEINSARTELTGSWIQDGQSTPATVKRADYQAEQALDTDKDYTFISGNDLQGHWRGSWVATIAKTKVTIRLALDIARLPDGSYSATFANLDQFGNDDPIPTSAFRFEPPNLHLEWKWAGGAYEGKLKNGKLIGTWLQGGGSFPLVFERSGTR